MKIDFSFKETFIENECHEIGVGKKREIVTLQKNDNRFSLFVFYKLF